MQILSKIPTENFWFHPVTSKREFLNEFLMTKNIGNHTQFLIKNVVILEKYWIEQNFCKWYQFLDLLVSIWEQLSVFPLESKVAAFSWVYCKEMSILTGVLDNHQMDPWRVPEDFQHISPLKCFHITSRQNTFDDRKG